MDERYAIARYEQAALLLPPRWQRLARQLPDHQKARAEELRLRAGQPMTVLLPEGEVWPSGEQPVPRVAQADLEQLCDMVTGYSRYAVSRARAAISVICPPSASASGVSRRASPERCCPSYGTATASAPR